MLGLTLYAALATADADVRASDLYALHGELSVFPPDEVCEAWRRLAYRHLEWLRDQAQTDGHVCPVIRQAVKDQAGVLDAYWELSWARRRVDSPWAGAGAEARVHADELRRLIGPDAYFFGRLPPPVPGWGQ